MRILLAVDGSAAALHAVRAVACLSPPDEILLVHAIELPNLARLAGYGVIVDPGLLGSELTKRGEEVLEQAAACLPPATGAVTRRLESGSPADVILHVAEHERVDLIVLGARGLGRVHELMVGSVSHRVVYHAPCPAWVVHAPVTALRHALVPLAGQEDAEMALRFFAKHPLAAGSGLSVLSVVPAADPLWPPEAVRHEELVEQQIERTGRFVQEVVAQLEALGYAARGSTGLGPPATVILREAAAQGAEVVIMGSRRALGVRRLLVGSVSHAVLHGSVPSVLLFH